MFGTTLTIFSCYHTDCGRTETPTMKRIMDARKNLTDFQWYCENFLSVIVGKQIYKKEKANKLISAIATRSDEALLLVLMENSVEHWTAEVLDPNEENEKWPEAKYTSKGNDSKKHLGWSEEGIERYNYYMADLLPKLRKSSRKIEVELRELYRHGTGAKQGKQGERKIIALLQSDTEEEEGEGADDDDDHDNQEMYNAEEEIGSDVERVGV